MRAKTVPDSTSWLSVARTSTTMPLSAEATGTFRLSMKASSVHSYWTADAHHRNRDDCDPERIAAKLFPSRELLRQATSSRPGLKSLRRMVGLLQQIHRCIAVSGGHLQFAARQLALCVLMPGNVGHDE